MDSNADDRAKVVKAIFASLKTDYGERFTRQFASSDVGVSPDQLETAWKRRLYRSSREDEVEPSELVDGYEDAVKASPSRAPTLPEVLAAGRERRLQRYREQNAEPEWRAAPDVKSLENYVDEVLAPAAKGNPVAERELERMKTILARPAARTPEERKQRIEEVVAELEAQIRSAAERMRLKGGPNVMDEHFRCSRAGCRTPGTLSGGTGGGAKWYCREHFSRA